MQAWSRGGGQGGHMPPQIFSLWTMPEQAHFLKYTPYCFLELTTPHKKTLKISEAGKEFITLDLVE